MASSYALPNLSTLDLREGEEEEAVGGSAALGTLKSAIAKKQPPKRRLRVPPSEDLPIAKRNQQAAELQPAKPAHIKAVEKLFRNVNPTRLSQGKDQAERLGNYSTIVPVGVWNIVYGGTNTALLSYRDELKRIKVQDCTRYGTPRECVRTDAAFAYYMQDDNANDLPPLNEALNEKLLLHGTSPESVMNIIAGNFDAWRAGVTGQAFGPGVYQAEDAGKADQYARSNGYEVLNRELELPSGADMAIALGSPRPNTYYMLVSRTLLGCANHVSHGQMNRPVMKIQDLDSRMVYQRDELTRYQSLLRAPYNSLIKEHFGTLRGGYGSGDKYREFLVQNSSQILPVMLVAYMRVWKPLDELPRFDPKELGCDRIAPLLEVLRVVRNSSNLLDDAFLRKTAALVALNQILMADRRKIVDELEQLVQSGGVAVLCGVLDDRSTDVRSEAAKALWVLLSWAHQYGRLDVHRALVAADGHRKLVAMFARNPLSANPSVLTDRESKAKERAFQALATLTRAGDRRVAKEILGEDLSQEIIKAMVEALVQPADKKDPFVPWTVPEELAWVDEYGGMEESGYSSLHKAAGELLLNLLNTLMHPETEPMCHFFVKLLVEANIGALCHRLLVYPVYYTRSHSTWQPLDWHDVTLGTWLLYALEHAQGVRPTDPTSIEAQAWEHGLLQPLLDVYRNKRGGLFLDDKVRNKAGQLLHKYLAGGRKATKIIKAMAAKAYKETGVSNERAAQVVIDGLPAYEREYEHITDALPQFWDMGAL